MAIRRGRLLVMVSIGVAVMAAACDDVTAPAGARPATHAPAVTGQAERALLDCEVTIGSALVRPIGLASSTRAGLAPAIECSPATGGRTGRHGADRPVTASDTILQRFADIGFTYGTPTWSLLAGSGTMTVPIMVINHISKPLGTSDGVHAATNGTRVFIMSGPTVLASGGLGLLPTVTVNNNTGTSTFTSAGQKYFQYAGIIQPDSASTAVNWTFGIVDVSKFNFEVGVDAITP
jgi:hypothetical protein